MFFVSFVSHTFASVHCCLVVTCWERADLLALVGDVYCIFVTFPCGIPGSGVVLDCIVSWSLSPLLLFYYLHVIRPYCHNVHFFLKYMIVYLNWTVDLYTTLVLGL